MSKWTLHIRGSCIASVVLIGKAEFKAELLSKRHKHRGCWSLTRLKLSQHGWVGLLDTPWTNGAHMASGRIQGPHSAMVGVCGKLGCVMVGDGRYVMIKKRSRAAVGVVVEGWEEEEDMVVPRCQLWSCGVNI
ncbi:hypothetical protein L1987_52575 [Smallanthus sonchifolius]|uniref:Uncharacterized protein n=2 Tax=Smallanthus sonchifolius TaxID=185202 RepID=A0ACB9ETM1_9ASTR|nr:hypothetical protein L1987_52573 [Smallanthus sonchifolius]KAI3762152.1 hypothetical protein L1987_52575 [Smallanthus sonchifolius]